MDATIKSLLDSDEPSMRYKVRVGVLGEDNHAPSVRALQRAIKASPRVKRLLMQPGEEAG